MTPRYENYVAACNYAGTNPETTTPGKYFAHISDGKDWGESHQTDDPDALLRWIEETSEYGSLQTVLDLDTNIELEVEVVTTARFLTGP